MTVSASQLVFFIGTLFCLLQKGLAVLPTPQNIRVHSLNFKSILLWDPVILENDTVKYNVSYESIFGSVKTTVDWCIGITITYCDVTKAFPYNYRVILSVRAEAGQKTSDFAALVPYFDPLQNTTIGPPRNVQLESRSGALHIFIHDPVNEIENRSVRFLNVKLKYMVHYWVKNTEKKQSFETTASIAKLDDVEAQATYCVQVVTLFRVYVEDFRKGGSSVPSCITVSTSEDSFGYLFVPLVAFLLTIALTAVGVFLFIKYFRHNVKQIFHPSHRIPPHIEEFLQNPEQYYISSKLEETVSVPEQFDSLSFISDRD